MQRREWVPDINLMAEQLIEDVGRAEDDSVGGLDAVGTFAAWQHSASDHGEEIQEDDYQALAILLARKAAAHMPRGEDESEDDAGENRL